MGCRSSTTAGVSARLWIVTLMCCLSASTACSSLRYYAHVAHGEAVLLMDRKPIAEIIDDPHGDATLRARLHQAQAARAFASDHLALPRNRSYASYVELGRPYVTWNVFAAPEFSVDPLTHCFPFAGCVAYLGFFDKARAEHAAQQLDAQGDDTSIEGAAAFSTLGWFADPILSSMLRWSDDELDSVIFHELTHQQFYVKDDTAFNESYATFVQKEGLREWRAARGLNALQSSADAHDAAFTRLVLDLRERLRALYAQSLSTDAKRAAKRDAIADFRERYAHLRDAEWGGDRSHDRWVAAPINNARLLPFGLYDRWIPAFAQLFRNASGNWPAFHQRVRQLGRLPEPQRTHELNVLAGAVAAVPG